MQLRYIFILASTLLKSCWCKFSWHNNNNNHHHHHLKTLFSKYPFKRPFFPSTFKKAKTRIYSIPFPVVLLAWCTSATVPCESALYVGEYREKSQASGTRKKARKREAPLRRRALSCSSLFHVISNYKIKLRKMHTRGNNPFADWSKLSVRSHRLTYALPRAVGLHEVHSAAWRR